MTVYEKLNLSIKNNEINKFLCGEYPYEVEKSQFSPSVEPTDIGAILSKGIYVKYQEDDSIKNIFEQSLMGLLDGTALDVYVVVLYIMSQLFKENHRTSPFEFDFDNILIKTKEKLYLLKNELKGECEFPNGDVVSDLWSNIERFNKVCQSKYNVSLL